MSYKAYYTYSNALKNVRKQKSLNFILLFFLFFDRNCFIKKKCTHFNSKFHTFKLIKLTNVRFYIEGFFLSFILCHYGNVSVFVR